MLELRVVHGELGYIPQHWISIHLEEHEGSFMYENCMEYMRPLCVYELKFTSLPLSVRIHGKTT